MYAILFVNLKLELESKLEAGTLVIWGYEEYHAKGQVISNICKTKMYAADSNS